MTSSSAARANGQVGIGLPVRFERRAALGALPWFELDGDDIVLADRSIGPIIDVHTHLALPAIKPHRFDLDAETTGDNLLLDGTCPHNLDVYANVNFSPSRLRSMKRELIVGALFGGGKRRHQTAPNLERDMRSVGVEHSWVLAIDFFFPSNHVADTLRAAHDHATLTGFGSVYPRRKRGRQLFEEQLHVGARGIKIHPPNMLMRPNAPEAMPIYAWCGEVGIPVFWHCGPTGIEPKAGARRAQVEFYEEPLARNPETTFVLGHSGALQHLRALDLQRRYPNAYLDISSISLPQLEDLLRDGDIDRILFGSDWPFYHPVLPLAKVLIATEGRPQMRRKILYENAARLMERFGAG